LAQNAITRDFRFKDVFKKKKTFEMGKYKHMKRCGNIFLLYLN